MVERLRWRPVEFLVTRKPVRGHRRPIIAVDGPVQGADLCWDHHATGEPVNLLTIPDEVPPPGTIATTMVDTDAVLSAAVVLLRAAGQDAMVRRIWAPLYEAAHYCDWLGPSGQHPDAEEVGLGLHCWLKERGMGVGEVLAWQAGELSGTDSPRPSARTRGRLFRMLTLAVVQAIHRGTLPADRLYLQRLRAMEARVHEAVERVEGQVTVLAPAGYLDPVAIYRVIDTDLMLLRTGPTQGPWRYTLGVHPRAYRRIDLRRIFAALNRREPGWGGAANRGGAPVADGSRIPLDDLLVLLNEDGGRG